jgi:hypothetical protein
MPLSKAGANKIANTLEFCPFTTSFRRVQISSETGGIVGFSLAGLRSPSLSKSWLS